MLLFLEIFLKNQKNLLREYINNVSNTNSLKDTIQTIVNELKKGNTICVRDFFTMKPKQYKERTYKSINTKELYTVPSKTKVKVSISKVLEGELNEK